MNVELKKIYDDAAGRYFTDVEESQLRGFAEGMMQRIETMKRVEQAEIAIVQDVTMSVLGRYPEIRSLHGQSSEAKIRRDQTYVLRYAAMSHVLMDPNYIYDRLAVWLRTILMALVNAEYVTYGLGQLVTSCRKHLPEDDANAVVPYIETVLQEFTNYRSAA